MIDMGDTCHDTLFLGDSNIPGLVSGWEETTTTVERYRPTQVILDEGRVCEAMKYLHATDLMTYSTIVIHLGQPDVLDHTAMQVIPPDVLVKHILELRGEIIQKCRGDAVVLLCALPPKVVPESRLQYILGSRHGVDRGSAMQYNAIARRINSHLALTLRCADSRHRFVATPQFWIGVRANSAYFTDDCVHFNARGFRRAAISIWRVLGFEITKMLSDTEDGSSSVQNTVVDGIINESRDEHHDDSDSFSCKYGDKQAPKLTSDADLTPETDADWPRLHDSMILPEEGETRGDTYLFIGSSNARAVVDGWMQTANNNEEIEIYKVVIPGAKVYEVKNRLMAMNLMLYDCIILHVGMCDVYNKQGILMTEVDEMVRRILDLRHWLVQNIRAKTVVLINALTPKIIPSTTEQIARGKRTGVTLETSTQYNMIAYRVNRRLSEIIKREGSRHKFVVTSAFWAGLKANPACFVDDCVHISRSGSWCVAQALRQALQEATTEESPSDIECTNSAPITIMETKRPKHTIFVDESQNTAFTCDCIQDDFPTLDSHKGQMSMLQSSEKTMVNAEIH